MNRIKSWMTRDIAWRMALVLIGNLILGLGVTCFKLSGQGNDPFNGMNMALSAVVGISYGTLQMLENLVLLVIQFIFARKLIGFGTIVNACFAAYIATFWMWVLRGFSVPDFFMAKLGMLALGVIICGLGLSAYQQADLGVAPYDAISIIIGMKFDKIPYFWRRIFVDALATLICFLAGGIVGLGTLAAAFGLGPVIQLFNKIIFKDRTKV